MGPPISQVLISTKLPGLTIGTSHPLPHGIHPITFSVQGIPGYGGGAEAQCDPW